MLTYHSRPIARYLKREIEMSVCLNETWNNKNTFLQQEHLEQFTKSILRHSCLLHLALESTPQCVKTHIFVQKLILDKITNSFFINLNFWTKNGILTHCATISMLWFLMIFALIAYVLVSITIWIVARFSPYEWASPDPCEETAGLVFQNDFTLPNSFWFAIGTLMQQG